MKIYTKTGDQGTTNLYGGQRVMKDSARIQAVGLLDELNASLGLVLSQYTASPVDVDVPAMVEPIQHTLFSIGAHTATQYTIHDIPESLPAITEEEVQQIEQAIDALQEGLPELAHFILPGGSLLGAQLHVTRAVCRRTERALVELHNENDVELLPEILQYMNRLSDFLFVLARAVNYATQTPETQWIPNKIQ